MSSSIAWSLTCEAYVASRGVLVEGALDLAWSHWVGLGVSGVARPPDTAVDLEALLYFTAYVADHDPRLRDEVADWWHQFEQHVSGPRLNAMSNTLDEVRWHGFRDGFPGVKKLSGKSRLERLDTPARSQLRMRAVFGANARAEIMLEMLTSTSDEGWTALALSETGYSKRNIAMVLESLVLGGILTATSEGNRTRYRLRDRDGLARVLAPLPQSSGQWHLRLPIVATFLDLASRIERKDAVTQGIEAQKLVTKLQPELVAVGGLPRLPHAAAATYWPALQKWIVRQLLAERDDSRRAVDRTIEGLWFGPEDIAARALRPDGAVLPRVSADADADELRCLDLVQVPTVSPSNDWAWGVLSRSSTGTYRHTIGLDRGEQWRFVAVASGHAYEVSYDEDLPYERIAKLYGADAAARARADRPAVQLKLRRRKRATS